MLVNGHVGKIAGATNVICDRPFCFLCGQSSGLVVRSDLMTGFGNKVSSALTALLQHSIANKTLYLKVIT
jgi:hypothetical protein